MLFNVGYHRELTYWQNAKGSMLRQMQESMLRQTLHAIKKIFSFLIGSNDIVCYDVMQFQYHFRLSDKSQYINELLRERDYMLFKKNWTSIYLCQSEVCLWTIVSSKLLQCFAPSYFNTYLTSITIWSHHLSLLIQLMMACVLQCPPLTSNPITSHHSPWFMLAVLSHYMLAPALCLTSQTSQCWCQLGVTSISLCAFVGS